VVAPNRKLRAVENLLGKGELVFKRRKKSVAIDGPIAALVRS